MANIILQVYLVSIIFCVISAFLNDVGFYHKTYFFTSELTSWDTAQELCVENGLEPLAIDSKEEEIGFLLLVKETSNIASGYYHIGGIRLDDEWKWKSGSSFGYPNITWAPGEPNNSSGLEDCLSIYKSVVNDTGLNDICCELEKKGFFCQKRENSTKSIEEDLIRQLGTQKALEQDLRRQLESQRCRELNLERQLESKNAKERNLESQLQNQTNRALELKQQLDVWKSNAVDSC